MFVDGCIVKSGRYNFERLDGTFLIQHLWSVSLSNSVIRMTYTGEIEYIYIYITLNILTTYSDID